MNWTEFQLEWSDYEMNWTVQDGYNPMGEIDEIVKMVFYELDPDGMSLNSTSGEDGSAVFYPGMRLMYYFLILLAAFGIICNIVVLTWLIRFRRKNRQNLGEALVVMCVSDCFCLALLLVYGCLGELVLATPLSQTHKTIFCKAVMYGIHTMSSLSVWCWMLIASVRFMAIYTPLFYRKHSLLSNSYKILIGILCVIALVQSWILFATVFYTSQNDNLGDCVVSRDLPAAVTKKLKIVELTMNFFAPVLLTVLLDVTVLCFRPPSAHRLARPPTDKSPRRRRHYRRRVVARLWRYLLLARWRFVFTLLCSIFEVFSVDLFLNTPISVIRLLGVLEMSRHYLLAFPLITAVAHVMYYAQFSINILYVWVLAVRTDSGKPRRAVNHGGDAERCEMTNCTSNEQYTTLLRHRLDN